MCHDVLMIGVVAIDRHRWAMAHPDPCDNLGCVCGWGEGMFKPF